MRGVGQRRNHMPEMFTELLVSVTDRDSPFPYIPLGSLVAFAVPLVPRMQVSLQMLGNPTFQGALQRSNATHFVVTLVTRTQPLTAKLDPRFNPSCSM